MSRNTDSELKFTMSTAATETFDMILDCVKKSNLNFCLQLSPFSANISLKKTFVKDKAGVYLDPPPFFTVPISSDSLLLQNSDLEKKVNDLETIVEDLKSLYQTVNRHMKP